MHLLYVMRQVGPTNYNYRASSKGILLWNSRHICENVVVTEEFYFYCDDWPNMAVASAVTDRSNNRILPKCHREDGFYKGVLIIKEVKCQGYKVEIQMGSSHSSSLVYSGDEGKSFEDLHFYFFEYSHFDRNIYIS